MVLSPVSAVSHFLQCSACLLLAPLFTSHLGPQAKCGQSQLLWPSQQQHMLGGGSEEAQWSGKWEARDSGNAHPASILRNRGPRCSCSISPRRCMNCKILLEIVPLLSWCSFAGDGATSGGEGCFWEPLALADFLRAGPHTHGCPLACGHRDTVPTTSMSCPQLLGVLCVRKGMWPAGCAAGVMRKVLFKRSYVASIHSV